MIDKSGEYWHLYFNEYCNDEPAQIFALIEKLFGEIAEMGNDSGGIWYLRARPSIERDIMCGTGTRLAHLYCRFSAKAPSKETETEMRSFGLLRCHDE